MSLERVDTGTSCRAEVAVGEMASLVGIPRIDQEGVAEPALRGLAGLREREHIPAPVRREVFDRDGGCCTFVGDDGHVCGSRFAVQIHHRVAWAHGGSNAADNLTLHCGPHNRLVATREGLGRRPRRSSPAGPRDRVT
ncbi:MAG: HNH endonuclease [Myxococcales bacterium]|nr:HNH endonuclease [Myxococcales bacterium]